MQKLTDHHEEVIRYWDAIAQRYLELFRDELRGKPYDLDVLRAFASTLGSEARVCDAGCGPCAHVTRFLADQGLDVIGIDVSPNCVSLARQEQPSLSFETMDMAHMTFADATFDGLVAYYAFHYLPKSDLACVIQEFARVLRPGGRLLLVAKDGDSEGWIADPVGSGEQVFWCAVPAKELETVIAKNGFRVLHCTLREPFPDEIAARRIYVAAEHQS